VNSSEKGRRGEDRAAAYLEGIGYRILERNYRAFGAEIDIVAEREETLAFVEVKNWDAFGFDQTERTVNSTKAKRVLRASKGFIGNHREFDTHRLSYDLIFIGRDRIEHIEDALSEML
jgi:putative endonuclease